MSIRERLLLIAVAFLAWPALVRAGSPVDVLHYDIAVQVQADADAIVGQTTLLFSTDRAVRRIALDFKEMHVALVEMDGTPLEFTQHENILQIRLVETTMPGKAYAVKIGYEGKPADGLIIRKNLFGRKTIFADNWPNRASYWFPGVDHPADKATVSFEITAPREYLVVANGAFMRLTDHLDGTRTTTYKSHVAIPTYCMVFGAAEFDVVDAGAPAGVPLSFWGYPQSMEMLIANFERAGNMLEYYSARFGPFPYEKLALVQSSTRFGGMENAGAIFFSERAFGDEKSAEGTTAHEIVHQWFGDWLTPQGWQDLWLSEGFATYFGMQYYEYADGADSFRQRLRSSRQKYLEQKKFHQMPMIGPLPDDLYLLLNPNNYTRGGWVLHMLRRLVGEAAFWPAIAAWVGQHAGGNVGTRDFQQFMEAQTGQELAWFFDQWVYQSGVPDLRVSYDWDAQRRELHLQIKQVQQSNLFRLPLTIQARGEATEQKLFWIVKRDQTFTWPLQELPAELLVDPDVDLLAHIVSAGAATAVEKSPEANRRRNESQPRY